ncbi:unnamed protein product [Caenorhabditis auriculariae]|uniref:Uncharacterized protein n=1 Tax=Caenorhabditis auriculariae TaxID=2777116 RepID=A0A8S1HUI7_9PELO|nr:unnamed protein product [Caenorhabditis auriculariae]
MGMESRHSVPGSGPDEYRMRVTVILLCALSGVAALNPDVVEKVQNAVGEALGVMDNRLSNESTVKDGQIMTSQKANEQSKDLQFTADILQEVTQILVTKYGVEILPEANEVIESMLGQSDEDDSSLKRKKRQSNYGGGGGSQSTPTKKNCQVPSDNCRQSFHLKTRSITGICNNLENKKLGNSVTAVRRLLGVPFYDDNLNALRTRSVNGGTLPSTRLISNTLHDEGAQPAFDGMTNHMHMQVGQFIAHDIIFMPSSTGSNGEALNCTECNSGTKISSNCAPIPAPADDKYFKPVNGPRCIRLTRALNGQKGLGVRTQINQNSHFLDLSSVYGSSDCEAQSVRSNNGLLEIYMGNGNVLPPQAKNDSNCQSTSPYFCFTCGDFRNSLHPGLVPLHVVFIKEHNRISQLLRAAKPLQSDNVYYQLTRKIMIGVWQHIVYNEYLPRLLPDDYINDFDIRPGKPGDSFYKGYSSTTNPSLSAEFAAAAFRFGHSQARKDFPRQSNTNGSLGTAVNIGSNIFYAESQYQTTAGATESLLQGMLYTPAMKVDQQFSFPIRNQLFEIRGQPASGVDLVAVNIMRGRDIGLGPYAKYRYQVGLPPVYSWNDLNQQMPPNNVAALKTVYDDPRDVDLYTGILMERPLQDGMLGPTGSHIIAEQFRALKKGDRFYYENDVGGTEGFTRDQLDAIRRVKLSKILCMNTPSMINVNLQVFDTNSPKVPCTSIPEIAIQPFIAAL